MRLLGQIEVQNYDLCIWTVVLEEDVFGLEVSEDTPHGPERHVSAVDSLAFSKASAPQQIQAKVPLGSTKTGLT